MKQPVEFFRWRPFLVMLFLSLVSLAIWGQGEGGESTTATSTNIRVTGNAWYMSPWVWVIGVAVFILLLVAILSSQGTGSIKASKTKDHQSTTS